MTRSNYFYSYFIFIDVLNLVTVYAHKWVLHFDCIIDTGDPPISNSAVPFGKHLERHIPKLVVFVKRNNCWLGLQVFAERSFCD